MVDRRFEAGAARLAARGWLCIMPLHAPNGQTRDDNAARGGSRWSPSRPSRRAPIDTINFVYILNTYRIPYSERAVVYVDVHVQGPIRTAHHVQEI